MMMLLLNVCMYVYMCVCDIYWGIFVLVLVTFLTESCSMILMFEYQVVFDKVKYMVAYMERLDSQWQEVEYWFRIRIMLKCRWDFSGFKNHQGMVPLSNQTNLFLILRVIYVFIIHTSNHSFLHILPLCVDTLTYI